MAALVMMHATFLFTTGTMLFEQKVHQPLKTHRSMAADGFFNRYYNGPLGAKTAAFPEQN